MASNLREFVQLAHVFDGSQNVAAWYYSTKLDGWRAIWDGGITRGMELKDVPWANTVKDGRYVVIPKATGLWSRYGKSIQAPDWFLDQLPDYPLDGELYMGRGGFQRVMSVTKKLNPDDEWSDVAYQVFDSPSYRELFADGEIRQKGKYEKVFSNILQWVLQRVKTQDSKILRGGRTFEETQEWLLKHLPPMPNAGLSEQTRLPFSVGAAKEILLFEAEKEVKRGGEGLIVRQGRSLWVPKRSRLMLKVKPYQDSEGMVVGYVWGEMTELGSKLLGLMGSVIVQWGSKQFRLSGFTEEERVMVVDEYQGKVLVDVQARAAITARMVGCEHPGEVVEPGFYNPKFPPGSAITFQFRELTNDGFPKEARYWRKRDE
jgi:hypothetical protein